MGVFAPFFNDLSYPLKLRIIVDFHSILKMNAQWVEGIDIERRFEFLSIFSFFSFNTMHYRHNIL